MDEFACESSIAGARVFHNSESKLIRILWFFVYFLAFCLVGFYVFTIYTRCRVEPEFSYEFSEFPLQEIPFPAVTICHPLFARDQIVNIQKVFKNSKQNYSPWQQSILAAGIQACAPHLGAKYHQFYPLAKSEEIVKALHFKFLKVNHAFKNNDGCDYNWAYIECSKILNYVLTDFGFCFTFNLEGYQTLFNTDVIADDFECYKRDKKIIKNYNLHHPDHGKKINEANQSIDWIIEKGYLTTNDTLPVRALYKKNFAFYGQINDSDLSNLCPEMGRRLQFFLHMPNEILTPFHKPIYIRNRLGYILNAKIYKVDESLQPFSPKKRNCYFQGERKLKFFKSYTKALCQFECLANFTLTQCGCVKFSMPRENSTRICGLNETSCYIEVAKNWNLTCDCLHSCTYIEYEIKQKLWISSGTKKPLITASRIYFEDIFGEMIKISGSYNMFQGFADFGGMLGTLFGASLITFFEIFYFIFLNLARQKFKILESSEEVDVSEFASSSTVHGVQFIFDKSRHKFVRLFWILAFFFAVSCCIYNSRESYWKLNVYPDTESIASLRSSEEIPFPTIFMTSPLIGKEELVPNYIKFFSEFTKNYDLIQTLNQDQYCSLLANYYWLSPNVPRYLIKYRNIVVKNITSDYDDHRSEVDLFPCLNQSHLQIDELLKDCKFQGVKIQCSKIIKRVMTIRGICYVFNLQNHNEIFNKEISKNYDSYGKFGGYHESQWSLDQGYHNSLSQYPMRAYHKSILDFEFRALKGNSSFLTFKFFTTSPNEILTHLTFSHLIFPDTENTVKIKVKSKRAEKYLRKFAPENRGCYFEDEKKLQFFKTYSKTKCILECFTNYTLKSCGCVIYLLPHNNSVRICDSANEAKCFDDYLRNFPPFDDNLNPCQCLSTCNNIEYILDKTYKEIKVPKNTYFVRIRFQFDEKPQIPEEEIRVAFKLQDFLTNVGGLLGLYLGCSFISVIEVFYFLFVYVSKIKIKTKLAPSSETLAEVNLGLSLMEIFDFK